MRKNLLPEVEGAGVPPGVQANYRCPMGFWRRDSPLAAGDAETHGPDTRNGHPEHCGTTDRLNEPNNGNFLKFVEMLGIFALISRP